LSPNRDNCRKAPYWKT